MNILCFVGPFVYEIFSTSTIYIISYHFRKLSPYRIFRLPLFSKTTFFPCCSLAIEKSGLDLNKLNDDSRELLLVIEGSLTDDMMGDLLELLESGTFILRKDGQVVVKERKVKR